jgi:hypothetical protein
MVGGVVGLAMVDVVGLCLVELSGLLHLLAFFIPSLEI